MKFLRRMLLALSILLVLVGILIASGALSPILVQMATALLKMQPAATWPYRMVQIGVGFILVGGLLILTLMWIIPNRAKIASDVKKAISNRSQWKQIILGRFFDLEMVTVPERFTWPKFNGLDGAILLGFLTFAVLVFLGSIQGDYPYLLLGSDAGNVASYAVGFDHPEFFKGDMLLGQTQNIQVYSTFNVYFARWLYPLVGSYSLSLSLLIPLIIFINLFSFYWLGRTVFQSRIWSGLLTGFLAMPFQMNLGEVWGVSPDPLARFVFQAFLPIVLSLILIWRENPSRWPWVMVAAGLLFYLHPVSAPIWTAAIWMSFWIISARKWRLLVRFAIMIGLGAIFAVVAMPYVLTYFNNHVQGVSPNYDLVYRVITELMPANLINIPEAVADFLIIVGRSGLLFLFLLGLLPVLVFVEKSRRFLLWLVAIWAGVMVAISVLFPWIIHTIERSLRMIPAETELVRGIRYSVFFMLFFYAWGLFEVSQRARSRTGKIGVILFAAASLLAWGWRNPPPVSQIQQAVICLAKNQIICKGPTDYDKVIRAIGELTPLGAPVYVTFSHDPGYSYGTPIRYSALRPLVYSYKDRGQLVYSNDQVLQKWFSTYSSLKWIYANYDDQDVIFKKHIPIADELGARYLVTELKLNTPTQSMESIRLIYSNSTFRLFELRK